MALAMLLALQGLTASAADSTATEDTSAPQPAHTGAPSPAHPQPGGAASAPFKLVYTPPLRGAPTGRLGGGTRGISPELTQLHVLAPDHVGLTLQEQPVLYWFVSQVPKHPVEFTLTAADAVRPLVETRIKTPAVAGVQALRLADYGVHLEREVLYQWFVAIVRDPEQRSRDIVAGGEMTRMASATGLAAQLQRAGSSDLPYLYASEGIWYDALRAISELIEASPGQVALVEQRASLLDQVGLKEVAEYERKRAAAGEGARP
jgi:hypothetical protein